MDTETKQPKQKTTGRTGGTRHAWTGGSKGKRTHGRFFMAEGPAAAGELIGNCELASAVVCVGFQPAGQRGTPTRLS